MNDWQKVCEVLVGAYDRGDISPDEFDELYDWLDPYYPRGKYSGGYDPLVYP